MRPVSIAGFRAQQNLLFGSKLNRNGVQRTIVIVGIDSETLNWLTLVHPIEKHSDCQPRSFARHRLQFFYDFMYVVIQSCFELDAATCRRMRNFKSLRE